jgi:hypothetical protein
MSLSALVNKGHSPAPQKLYPFFFSHRHNFRLGVEESRDVQGRACFNGNRILFCFLCQQMLLQYTVTFSFFDLEKSLGEFPTQK